eukprot:jgi/Astpho2/2076/Aster-x0078
MYRTSKEFPGNMYVVAQIDYMEEAAKGINYTPTFRLYHKGRRVDEFLPQHVQQIRDHLWLYSEVMINTWPGCLCIALQLAHLCLFLTRRDVLQSPS